MEGVGGLKYRSCEYVENFYLQFKGRIDNGSACIAFCCAEAIDFLPCIPFSETSEETMQIFSKLRQNFIAESMRCSTSGQTLPDEERKLTAGCVKCAKYEERDWQSDGAAISYIGLSPYPSPCQCKCIYCRATDLVNIVNKVNRDTCDKSYEMMFDMIDCALSKGMVAENVWWSVGSGEITLHPFKDRILNLIQGQHAFIHTNSFIFDERIAEELTANPKFSVMTSLDSGTPETYYKIKRVNNFKTVVDNLLKYAARSRQGQIYIKYIMLPGINDNLADYQGLAEIMKAVNTRYLDLSRDISTKYTLDAEERQVLISAAAQLTALLKRNGIRTGIHYYTPDEREKITNLAEDLLISGKI